MFRKKAVAIFNLEMSAEQLAAYTMKKYGAKLCATCATKAAQESKQARE